MPAKTNGNTARGGITRKEAVRQALGALAKDASRADIQKFIKDKYGFEMTLDHISNYKSDIRRKSGKGKKRGRKPGPKPAAAGAAPKAAANSRRRSHLSIQEADTLRRLLRDVEPGALKGMIDVLSR